MQGEAWDRAVVADALHMAHRRGSMERAHDLDPFGPMSPVNQNVSSRWAHERATQLLRRRLLGWFPGAQVLVDRRRRQGGVIVSRRRPDGQYDSPQRGNRRVYVEVDTTPGGMRRHIDARDPNVHSVFLRVDPNTGALLEQQVFPVGGQSYARLARPGGHLQMRQQDFFDD